MLRNTLQNAIRLLCFHILSADPAVSIYRCSIVSTVTEEKYI